MKPKHSNKVLKKYLEETELLKSTQVKRSTLTEPDQLPKKRDYRMRAHCNPLSDTPFPL